MPSAMRLISRFTPLTYTVDAMRCILLRGDINHSMFLFLYQTIFRLVIVVHSSMVRLRSNSQLGIGIFFYCGIFICFSTLNICSTIAFFSINMIEINVCRIFYSNNLDDTTLKVDLWIFGNQHDVQYIESNNWFDSRRKFLSDKQHLLKLFESATLTLRIKRIYMYSMYDIRVNHGAEFDYKSYSGERYLIQTISFN